MAVDVKAVQADNALLSARATSLVSEIEQYKKDLKQVVTLDKQLKEALLELDSADAANAALKQQLSAQSVEVNALKGQVAALAPKAEAMDAIVAQVKKG